jgi:tetratricopeptide (TPR) repeat protein
MKLKYSLCMLLVVITAITYCKSISNEFINYDDNYYVTDNANVQNGLTINSIVWAFKETSMINYHPMTWLSHIVDYELYGTNPVGHHMTNIVLHILNSLLLFTFLTYATKKTWESFFVAALFAIHPLHVESVAWIAERKDLLSAFFGFTALIAYLSYVKRPAAIRYLLVFISYLLGLMSKPMLVTLPYVMLLVDYWPLGRFKSMNRDTLTFDDGSTNGPGAQCHRWKQIIIEKIPFILLSTVFCFITYYTQQKAQAVLSFEKIGLFSRIANALVAYATYMMKMVLPVRLAIIYPTTVTVPLWQISVSLFVLTVLTALFVGLKRNYPYLLVGWLWFLGTLVPVIGIVKAGDISMADRYTYIPLVGLFVIITWGASDILEKCRSKKMVVSGLIIATIAVLSAVTMNQLTYWKNSKALFTHALDVTTNNCKAHNNLGVALAQQGNIDEAVAHFIKSYEICPTHDDAYFNLGYVFESKGNRDEAVIEYEKALKVNPRHAKAHYSLGELYARRGNFDAAAGHFQQAALSDPNNVKAHYNLGACYLRMNKIAEALNQFNIVLRIKPEHEGARRGKELSMQLLRSTLPPIRP